MKFTKSHSYMPNHAQTQLMDNSTKAESINFSSPLIKRRKTIIDKSKAKNLTDIKISEEKLECHKC